MKSFVSIWLLYLKKNRKVLILFGITCCIFAGIFALNDLPLSVVLYAALLSCIAAALLSIYGFYRFYGSYRRLEAMQTQISAGLQDLPDSSSNALEQLYQDLLQELFAEKLDFAAQFDFRRREMIDYYTLWAHQIKIPISAMRLLLQAQESGEHKKLMQELFKIEQYVEMMLQYLRLESMSSDLLLESYPLDSIVKQAVKKYASVFIYNNIKIEIGDLSCHVTSDEKWLMFVIEQVLSNALKYTKEGAIKIYLDPAASKTLLIEDTGIGIRSEDLPRVFERGFTGSNGRIDKKATGIGLYLCRRILDKLGHTISIQSETGKGTTVCINLSNKSRS